MKIISFDLFTATLLLAAVAGFAQPLNHLPSGTTVAANGTFSRHEPHTPGFAVSGNGVFHCTYEVGKVGDEYRELKNFMLYRDNRLIYTLGCLPGSDFMLSDAGLVAVFDHSRHFMRKVTITWLDGNGEELMKEDYAGASYFLFSPSGKEFVICASGSTRVVHPESGSTVIYPVATQAVWSENNEILLLTDRFGTLSAYKQERKVATFTTGNAMLRKTAVCNNGEMVAAVDKKSLTVYRVPSAEPVTIHTLDNDLSYRDVLISGDRIVTGIHYRNNGISRGLLEVYNTEGSVIHSETVSEKPYRTFRPEEQHRPAKSGEYDAIPWPFTPFNEVHTVWNAYEQHMGDGSGSWSYLHQGLDIIVPIGEPTYAVQEGFVKCVLTIGGAAYWRVAVSPEQVSGFSDGWLYAHLIENTIQVAVGDYVNLHDYLGDIIEWSIDWGHIHFVQIRDQGLVWQYDDDEWGINFNPLLALDPITDPVAPMIVNAAPGKKFEFCVNETSQYLNAQNLYGDIDIMVKVSDYHADSPWEQPAFTTWYTVKRLPDNAVVFPKTLGQIRNHAYTFYSAGSYEAYATLLYKLDYLHPSPPWGYESRNYWHILTNNNGDSIAELSEKQLAFPTQNYYDGDYCIVVDVYDEHGNHAHDSMEVTFVNGNISGLADVREEDSRWMLWPNPAKESVFLTLREGRSNARQFSVSVYNSRMQMVSGSGNRLFQLENGFSFDLTGFTPGLYFFRIEGEGERSWMKFLVIGN